MDEYGLLWMVIMTGPCTCPVPCDKCQVYPRGGKYRYSFNSVVELPSPPIFYTISNSCHVSSQCDPLATPEALISIIFRESV